MKRWRMRPMPAAASVAALTHDKCPAPVATLLAQRGIRTAEEASRFFRPSLEQLHDPFLMRDMQEAVERIEQALGNNERIMVYGDYDVDGTTAVALMYGFLSRFTGNLTFYIPDRYSEGYGISFKGVEHAHADDVRLIIALDCGIKALDKVQRARELGIDMIICDHHRPGAQLPEAVAVLDPKRDDCPYPCKELSGCGIGFKLVQGLAQRNGIAFQDIEPLLDLVAVSTACDIVPVTGENRILTHFGLKRLNDMPRPGFRVMMDMANVKRRMTVTDLVFTLGPRINAAGRIEHGRQAVELLLARDSGEAAQMGLRVDMNNTQRQELDKAITAQALQAVEDDAFLSRSWSTVVYDAQWHKGVIGIVASRLIERHYRPTVVLTESNGMATGSARSVKGFDVYEAIHACSDLLEQFGGHMYAAGLTMPLDNVEAFRLRFEEVVRSTLPEALRTPEEEVDLELDLSEVNDRLVNIVEHMAPFGPGNMKPVFLLRGLVARGEVRIVGEDHLKFSIAGTGASERRFDCIAFRQSQHYHLVSTGQPFSMLATAEFNEWQGRRSIQFNVKDIKPGTSGLLMDGPMSESLATAE